jgi:hypothetical protein
MDGLSPKYCLLVMRDASSAYGAAAVSLILDGKCRRTGCYENQELYILRHVAYDG